MYQVCSHTIIGLTAIIVIIIAIAIFIALSLAKVSQIVLMCLLNKIKERLSTFAKADHIAISTVDTKMSLLEMVAVTIDMAATSFNLLLMMSKIF